MTAIKRLCPWCSGTPLPAATSFSLSLCLLRCEISKHVKHPKRECIRFISLPSFEFTFLNFFEVVLFFVVLKNGTCQFLTQVHPVSRTVDGSQSLARSKSGSIYIVRRFPNSCEVLDVTKASDPNLSRLLLSVFVCYCDVGRHLVPLLTLQPDQAVHVLKLSQTFTMVLHPSIQCICNILFLLASVRLLVLCSHFPLVNVRGELECRQLLTTWHMWQGYSSDEEFLVNQHRFDNKHTTDVISGEVHNSGTCQWVGYIRQRVNSLLEAEKMIWATLTRAKLWKLDNWVRASAKQRFQSTPDKRNQQHGRRCPRLIYCMCMARETSVSATVAQYKLLKE